jgi:acetyl-CoA carboxylase biotin carboxyl carrier protein
MRKEVEVELKQIKELMAAMGRTGTKRITLKKDNFELIIERDEHANGRFVESQLDFSEEAKQPSALNRTDQALSRGSEMPARPMASPITTEGSKEDVKSLYVTSPVVGTFYPAPSPEDPAFIKVGDKVEKNTVVCIIEAMKVMNEIKANVTGIVAEILVEAGHPVEFGTKLFRIIE